MAITRPTVDISEIAMGYKNQDIIPFDENKHKFRKIAFDVYAPINDPSDNLWEVQETNDGKFLVRTHWNHEDLNVKESRNEGWDAAANKRGDNITLYYKDLPLINLSANEYGFDQKDPRQFINSLLSFMKDKKNVSALLQSLPQNKVAKFHKLANVLTWKAEDGGKSEVKEFKRLLNKAIEDAVVSMVEETNAPFRFFDDVDMVIKIRSWFDRIEKIDDIVQMQSELDNVIKGIMIKKSTENDDIDEYNKLALDKFYEFINGFKTMWDQEDQVKLS